jgi:tetratricopeptide (TPR) repeat protein
MGALLLACHTLGVEELRKAEAQRNLGAMHLDRGQPEAAIREYTRALRANPRDAEARFGIGEAYRRRGEHAKAVEHFKKALEYDPDLLEARLNLGAVYLEQERWADAIRENRALVEDPMFLFPERALVNLGWAEYRSGDLASAETHLRAAVQTNPRNIHCHLNLGIVLYEKGDLVEAVQALEEALEILKERPREPFAMIEAQARFRLAQTYLKLGQRERAIEHLRVASERGGASEWGQRSRDYIRAIE